MNTQIIEKNGKPEWVIVPYAEYQRLLEVLEDLRDIKDFDEAINSDEESLPAEMVQRIIEGEHPIRVWREYRGINQVELARNANITPAYLSQIETGVRTGSTQVIKSISKALNVEIDDLII